MIKTIIYLFAAFALIGFWIGGVWPGAILAGAIILGAFLWPESWTPGNKNWRLPRRLGVAILAVSLLGLGGCGLMPETEAGFWNYLNELTQNQLKLALQNLAQSKASEAEAAKLAEKYGAANLKEESDKADMEGIKALLEADKVTPGLGEKGATK